MIRNAIIVVLTLAAVLVGTLWVDSYRFKSTPQSWFIGPMIYGNDGRCEFDGELDHYGDGWHLSYPHLGRNNNQVICFRAERGSVYLRWLTHSTAALTIPYWELKNVKKNLGRLELHFYSGNVSQGPRAGGFKVRYLRIPIWLPLLLFATYPAITVMRYVARVRRNRGRFRGLCNKCRYNLTGNESGVCPECGEPIEDHGTNSVVGCR